MRTTRTGFIRAKMSGCLGGAVRIERRLLDFGERFETGEFGGAEFDGGGGKGEPVHGAGFLLSGDGFPGDAARRRVSPLPRAWLSNHSA